MVDPYEKLPDMCKTNNLFIMNGRICDYIEGHLTCKQSSVVDSFICDFHIIKKYIKYGSIRAKRTLL